MNRLEFERRTRRWSQHLLALKVGVSQPVIACAEAGEVSVETLEKIADILMIRPAHVLLKPVAPKADPEERAALIEATERGEGGR